MFNVFVMPIFGASLLIASFLGSVGWWLGVVGVLLILAGWKSYNSFTRRYQAASNALLAKHIYNALPPDGQQSVMQEVRKVLMSGAIPDRDPDGTISILPEGALFGFVALAMKRLGIESKIGDEWYAISNPYVAILGAEREIAFVSQKLQKKFGVDVTVNLRRTQ